LKGKEKEKHQKSTKISVNSKIKITPFGKKKMQINAETHFQSI